MNLNKNTHYYFYVITYLISQIQFDILLCAIGLHLRLVYTST